MSIDLGTFATEPQHVAWITRPGWLPSVYICHYAPAAARKTRLEATLGPVSRVIWMTEDVPEHDTELRAKVCDDDLARAQQKLGPRFREHPVTRLRKAEVGNA